MVIALLTFHSVVDLSRQDFDVFHMTHILLLGSYTYACMRVSVGGKGSPGHSYPVARNDVYMTIYATIDTCCSMQNLYKSPARYHYCQRRPGLRRGCGQS